MLSLVLFAALSTTALHLLPQDDGINDFIPYHDLVPARGNAPRPLPKDIQSLMISLSGNDSFNQVTFQYGFKRGSRVCVYTQGLGAKARASGTISFVGQTIDDIQETLYTQLKKNDSERAEEFNKQASSKSGSGGFRFWGYSFGAAYSKSKVHEDSDVKSSFNVTNKEDTTIKHQMNNITHNIFG